MTHTDYENTIEEEERESCVLASISCLVLMLILLSAFYFSIKFVFGLFEIIL